MESSRRGAAEGGFRIENPFALKVGQVFTGFGVGCGVGIGIGRPLNFGAIPVLNQVMSSARGATDIFSGATRHVNASMRKMGAKKIEAGAGCGVGIGHGFGVGLAVKPGVVYKIQSHLVQAMTKMMMKFGVAPDLSMAQGVLPVSLQSAMSMTKEPSKQIPIGSSMNLPTKVPEHLSESLSIDADLNAESAYNTSVSKNNPASYSSRTEKVINNFLQNPVLKGESSDPGELAGRLQSENSMLRMILQHQQVIEELKEENDKLRQILVEDLKVPASKLRANNSAHNRSACSDCFECRRKHRRNR